MEGLPAGGLRAFIESVASTSPITMIMVASRRVTDEGLARQVAVTMVIPLVTAVLTAFLTAYITQQVMAEQIISLKEEVRYNRDMTNAALVRINDRLNNERRR